MTTVLTIPAPASTDGPRTRRWLTALEEEAARRGLAPWPEDLRCTGDPNSGN